MTREEAIKGLRVLRRNFSGYKPNEEMLDMAIKALEQQKIGHWVSKGDVYPAWKYCSECKEPWSFDCGTPNYCPVCGAKMIESVRKHETRILL